MHIFLHGPLHIGKSTVIQRTIAALQAEQPLQVGGFITYRGGEDDPFIYIRSVEGQPSSATRLARYHSASRGITCFPEVFDTQGVALLRESCTADLICLDELGFLEQQSLAFQNEVFRCLDAGAPIIGVLREGDIPWQRPIKAHPQVTLYPVDTDNRDRLPAILCDALRAYIPPKEQHNV